MKASRASDYLSGFQVLPGNSKEASSDGAERWWKEQYGVEAIYLNDIAAGVLIQVGEAHVKGGSLTERVSDGLRYLLTTLWRLDLVRPVIAVFWPQEGVERKEGGERKEDGEFEKLVRLTWDQEQHRGDFSLRRAATKEEALKLLYALMGDTTEALDQSARGEKIDLATVADGYSEHLEQCAEERADHRLTRAVCRELERARASATTPDLVAALEEWLSSEEEEKR
jgi:hypothetical protein